MIIYRQEADGTWSVGRYLDGDRWEGIADYESREEAELFCQAFYGSEELYALRLVGFFAELRDFIDMERVGDLDRMQRYVYFLKVIKSLSE